MLRQGDHFKIITQPLDQACLAVVGYWTQSSADLNALVWSQFRRDDSTLGLPNPPLPNLLEFVRSGDVFPGCLRLSSTLVSLHLEIFKRLPQKQVFP